MSPCKLDQKRRSNTISEFETILSAYGIALAQPKESLGVSNIGVPEARQTLSKLRDRGVPKLLLARGTIIFAIIILFVLSLVSETMGIPTSDVLRPFGIASTQTIYEAVYTIFIGYIFVSMTMLIISIVFLYHDYYILASFEKARTVFPWDWFILSFIVILFGGFTFGLVFETTLLQIMSISMDASSLDTIIVYGFGLIIITIPFTLKVFIARYVHWRYPVHYKIDKKVKALRECILSSSSSSDIPTDDAEDIILTANRMVDIAVLSRALFGAFILLCVLSFIWFQIGQFIMIDLGTQIVSATISVGISLFLFWILRNALLTNKSDLENITGSILIFTYLIAIPFSYLSSGLLLSIIIIGFGFSACTVLLYKGKGLSKDHPALLGYGYHKSLLTKSNEDSVWNFISETLSELDTLMKENYIKLQSNGSQ